MEEVGYFSVVRYLMLPFTKTYYDILKQKEDFEANLIDMGLHAKGLAEYMISIEIEGWNNLSQWFHIANGIKELDYNGINYDDSYFMCRPAYEYETERQKLYHRLVKEITLFSYLYSGLEGIISKLQPVRCPNQIGKINSAAYYLKSSFPKWSLPIPCYDKTVRLCEKMFQFSFDKNYKLSMELGDCVSIHGLGLKMLYKVRNKIMHGDFFFPEPLGHSFTPPFQPEIINLCSRLILMNVQMLFLACRRGDYINEIEIYNSSILKKTEENEWLISEKSYLIAFHLKCPDFNSEQLELEFE
jgi:hypothetical protein